MLNDFSNMNDLKNCINAVGVYLSGCACGSVSEHI